MSPQWRVDKLACRTNSNAVGNFSRVFLRRIKYFPLCKGRNILDFLGAKMINHFLRQTKFCAEKGVGRQSLDAHESVINEFFRSQESSVRRICRT